MTASSNAAFTHAVSLINQDILGPTARRRWPNLRLHAPSIRLFDKYNVIPAVFPKTKPDGDEMPLNVNIEHIGASIHGSCREAGSFVEKHRQAIEALLVQIPYTIVTCRRWGNGSYRISYRLTPEARGLGISQRAALLYNCYQGAFDALERLAQYTQAQGKYFGVKDEIYYREDERRIRERIERLMAALEEGRGPDEEADATGDEEADAEVV